MIKVLKGQIDTMEKILLFYKYVPIEYPKQILNWQKKLCAELGLRGRIILAHEGVNGTVAGALEATDRYKQAMLEHPLFAGMDIKESPGYTSDFPRMRIVIKNEIVNLGLDPQVIKPENGGRHLTPQQAHDLMDKKPDDLVILDGRNNYESRIGIFEGAVKPNIDNFRDFPAYIDNHADTFKDKTVLMYCTGGIRCERASAYLKSKGVTKEVLQIEGGIHRYIEQYPNGHFKGKNYVFDARVAVKVTDDILGTCDMCDVPFDDYTNCINAMCNKQILSCPSCLAQLKNTCSERCAELVRSGRVVVRVINRSRNMTQKAASIQE
jgi:predicted sulfurtransferase